MILPQTKAVLKRLYEKYSEDLRYAKQDIKPANFGIGSGQGYSYDGIDDNDKHFIYNAIGSLAASVNDAYGPIAFDIENHYITEKKAIKELDILKEHIYNDIVRLKEIQNKYKDVLHSEYPIKVCLSSHEEVHDILEEIYQSDEFKEFNNPGQFDRTKKENDDLKFNEHWRKLKRKYLTHLLAFIPFLFIAGWLITHKEGQGLSALSKSAVLVVGGLITIFFNLIFNNHTSFKDSWKLLNKKSRESLKLRERSAYLKSLK